jgi:hypothetical protein
MYEIILLAAIIALARLDFLLKHWTPKRFTGPDGASPKPDIPAPYLEPNHRSGELMTMRA